MATFLICYSTLEKKYKFSIKISCLGKTIIIIDFYQLTFIKGKKIRFAGAKRNKI